MKISLVGLFSENLLKTSKSIGDGLITFVWKHWIKSPCGTTAKQNLLKNQVGLGALVVHLDKFWIFNLSKKQKVRQTGNVKIVRGYGISGQKSPKKRAFK